ncbi:MAG: TlpA family protein disulfide reductase, partial [Pseudomonadota bacterium]
QDLLDYENIISRTVPIKQRFVQLWTGESSYRDNLGKHAQLPAAYLIDKSGKVIQSYVGRIPPEAWDRIADLL